MVKLKLTEEISIHKNFQMHEFRSGYLWQFLQLGGWHLN